MVLIQFHRCHALTSGRQEVVLQKLSSLIEAGKIDKLETETSFYISCKDGELSEKEEQKLVWILSKPFLPHDLSETTFFKVIPENGLRIEIGPRLNFSTAFSTNAVSICHSIGLKNIDRIESSLVFLLTPVDGKSFTKEEENKMVAALHDRMTQCRYVEPLKTFDQKMESEPVFDVDILRSGRSALEKANKDLGLAFDDWDLDYYTNLFQEKIKRNPTSVECFDLAQSNSEHSRHWFFKGKMLIDGQVQKESLFQMIMDTQNYSNNNNVIKFNDNSSAMEGYTVDILTPENSCSASPLKRREESKRHIIFTAETHNFPTGVAPFPGATTGTGGRIRDVHCTGRGAHVVAGTAGYSFGNLHIPGYNLPWEEVNTYTGPMKFAAPVDIAVEASNGASDYGNKFGEPVLTGFARSFGLALPGGEWREYIKPIMFSAGIGMLEDMHIKKKSVEKGMEVVKIGGPVYRIGVGGGAASSVQVQGDNKAELDFGAVQRGDAEMEQKLNRFIRSCVELYESNPILSIHDQGAGGNGNVLKEIVEPVGAEIFADKFQLGDPTISILELWGAEYQESNALLSMPENRKVLESISQRERCPINFIGTVTGDKKIRLKNYSSRSDESADSKKQKLEYEYPVNLELDHVLGSMPQKEFKLEHIKPELKALSLPADLTIMQAIDRVLRLPSVASKRYLTNKVDRSVTGLVAQQQCVGYLHTPLADVAVTALSYFDTVGSATSIGEQPVKGLVDPACGARMTVGECLTNLVFARITNLKDVKCSGNWMWPAKLPGEGAALYDACKAMCSVMKELGIAIDGGKDSLSMAARVGSQTVKAPGTLVVSAYVGCPDIKATVTPDLKCPQGKGILLHVDVSCGKHRLGGSALAQCFKQIGNEAPDLDKPDLFINMFNVTQQCITEKLISAGHDVSDGGLLTCVLEMAFAGNVNINLNFEGSADAFVSELFSEELGLVLEVSTDNKDKVMKMYEEAGVRCIQIGSCSESEEKSPQVLVRVSDKLILDSSLSDLRNIWEETSYHLEKRQANPHCVEEERNSLMKRTQPQFNLVFDPNTVYDVSSSSLSSQRPNIAILREEGSNGDREMAAAFHYAGFQTWDVNMEDLCSGNITLDRFRGIAFVGGFSYADVLGSAKGWAATALFNKNVKQQFEEFFHRPDTFSLGVCNGCQLMALLGWVVPDEDNNDPDSSPQGLLLDENSSERFESRFVTVKINKSPSIMLEGMEGTVFGVWLAHGEGKMIFKSESLHKKTKLNNLIPVHYVDDSGEPTCCYPFNPNGSPDGIAAVCSEDGRHLAIMPHPERSFLAWQCPWMPLDMRSKLKATPWLKMFTNAYDWCLKEC